MILRRRVAALLVAVTIVTAIAVMVIGGGEDDASAPPREASPGLSERTPRLVEDFSVEELADQVLLLGFEGTAPSAELLDELRDRQLGGLLISSENWAGADAGRALTEELLRAGREDGRVPPLLATSQEGGEFRALPDLPPEQTELEIGNSGSIRAAEDWARASGEALKGASISLNLAPVADVATLDSPVAGRAFSDDPALAAEMTAAAIRGCEQADIACAPLHFPGLGAASEDTARAPATVGLDPASLESRDLEPFRAAFAEGAPAVVVSLAAYTAYDPVTPAALAEPVATGLLRDRVGFEGVAISDDLASGAVRAGRRVRAAAVEALAAGTDMVQISAPEEQEGVGEEIVAAVEDGRLGEERLAEAAARVMRLKKGLGLTGSG